MVKVRVKGTNQEGYITQEGKKGLVMVHITKNYNPFDRAVFYKEELEVIQ